MIAHVVRRLVTACLPFVVALSLVACISVDVAGGGSDVPEIRYHALQPVAAPEGVPASGPLRMELSPLEVRPLHQRRVVVRGADSTVEFLEFERWAEETREGVEFALRDALGRAPAWDVLPAGVYSGEPDVTLHPHLAAFEVVERSDAGWTVEVSLTLRLHREGRTVHAATHTARATTGEGGAGLGSAAAEALGEALAAGHGAWIEALR